MLSVFGIFEGFTASAGMFHVFPQESACGARPVERGTSTSLRICPRAQQSLLQKEIPSSFTSIGKTDGIIIARRLFIADINIV